VDAVTDRRISMNFFPTLSSERKEFLGMMNNEDTPRGTPYQQGRRPYPSKYQDNRYGSNENRYNAGENRFGSNSNHNAYGYNKNSNSGYTTGQHQHKKIDRFHRDPVNFSEKLVRQNDLIIKLLKEKRDRLPAPDALPAAEAENEATILNGQFEETERTDLSQDGSGATSSDEAETRDVADESPGNSL
jgi:hypothetical protein